MFAHHVCPLPHHRFSPVCLLKYRILEDSDTTGYKSIAAKEATEESKIRPIPYPRYSPDLNPMDYFLWNEVQR